MAVLPSSSLAGRHGVGESSVERVGLGGRPELGQPTLWALGGAGAPLECGAPPGANRASLG